MTRKVEDWLTSYVRYASVTEAPKLMHFWTGVSVIAGALRRKVWLDMKRFCWYANFYIIFVAPPGVVSKSTTADIGMDLLKQVPGIKFGPDVVTWPALVSSFAASCESFQYGDEWYPMSALTLVASELGNLINPQDREMINLYINLWDGRKMLEKVTKGSGVDIVECPWINLLGCTTPHWIADNMPSATVGGGFTSRCVFVYADKKDKLVAYVDEVVQEKEDEALRTLLIQDLEHIATNICGPYELSEDARKWGRNWYETLWNKSLVSLTDDRLDGYVARKQTHLHKLAMIIAASQRDERVILIDDLRLADQMIISTEVDLPKVFEKIGKSEESMQADRFILYIKNKGECSYEDAYKNIHAAFPNFRDFEGIMDGAIRSGLITLVQHAGEAWVKYTGGEACGNVI